MTYFNIGFKKYSLNYIYRTNKTVPFNRNYGLSLYANIDPPVCNFL